LTTTPHASNGRSWDFGERLVTVATLDGMPAGTRVLSTRPGTVITPAARDRLRQLRVELSVSSGSAVASAAPPLKLYLHAAHEPTKGASLAKEPLPRQATYSPNRVAAGTAVSPHSWTARHTVLRALQGVGAKVETLIAAPLEQTAAELAAVLAMPNHLGVLFTSERDWAACVANRRGSIRAVIATDKVSIEAAARDWGANLLIIDDRRSSPHTIRGWIDTFLRPGPRKCPSSRKE
jgi:ribose 5-phosphate isomerase RpiB